MLPSSTTSAATAHGRLHLKTQVSNNAYFYPSKRHHYDVMAKGLLYMYIPYYVPWDAEYINLHSLAVLHATVLHMHSC